MHAHVCNMLVKYIGAYKIVTRLGLLQNQDNYLLGLLWEFTFFIHVCNKDVGETGVGWDKFWLGQCPSVPNETPHGDTNYVFVERVTTAFTGATRIIDARFASELSPKITF